MKLKVEVNDDGTSKKIPWSGLPVAGTEGLFALTRPVRASYGWKKKTYYPAERGWSVTHVPTGRTHHLVDDSKLDTVRRRAKRMYKIFKKHGVHASKDIAAIAVVKDDFLRAFG